LLYHVTNLAADLAVKFTMRDERDRAGREYMASQAIEQAGLDIAPRAVLLDRTSYTLPVVVQTWLEGSVKPDVPTSDLEWDALTKHMALLHTLRVDQATTHFPSAVVMACSAEEALDLVQQQVARLPDVEHDSRLKSLLNRLATMRFPAWSPPTLALCRTDTNITNFVRRSGMWAAVDWEYSGWGDPAFELADLMMHPVYLSVAECRWRWVLERYIELARDPTIAIRVTTYRRIFAVWWVVRMCRYLYEIPRGLDKRLVSPAPDWEHAAHMKLAHYLELSEMLL
jgi:thiamine kinase-like enzyme